jgi:hypothetical protein
MHDLHISVGFGVLHGDAVSLLMQSCCKTYYLFTHFITPATGTLSKQVNASSNTGDSQATPCHNTPKHCCQLAAHHTIQANHQSCVAAVHYLKVAAENASSWGVAG